MDELDLKRKVLGDLKQFARAEMARDLARKHGKSLRLPWDPEDAPQGEPPAQSVDMEALRALGD